MLTAKLVEISISFTDETQLIQHIQNIVQYLVLTSFCLLSVRAVGNIVHEHLNISGATVPVV